MVNISLKSSAFLLVFGLLFLSNLAQCHYYTITAKCGKCQTTPGCTPNQCAFLNGGPLKNYEAGCAEDSDCEMFNMINMTISDVGCKGGCTTCCMIMSYNGTDLGQECVPAEAAKEICSFGPTPGPDPEPSPLSTGAIIGIAVGGFFGLALIIGIIIYCVKKSKKDGGYHQVE